MTLLNIGIDTSSGLKSFGYSLLYQSKETNYQNLGMYSGSFLDFQKHLLHIKEVAVGEKAAIQLGEAVIEDVTQLTINHIVRRHKYNKNAKYGQASTKDAYKTIQDSGQNKAICIITKQFCKDLGFKLNLVNPLHRRNYKGKVFRKQDILSYMQYKPTKISSEFFLSMFAGVRFPFYRKCLYTDIKTKNNEHTRDSASLLFPLFYNFQNFTK